MGETVNDTSFFQADHSNLMIRAAFVMGLISGGVTLWAIATGAFGFTVWGLFDVVAVVFLAIGVLRRSYLCAWLLFAYHVVSRAVMYFMTGQVPSDLAFTIALVYFMGIWGITTARRQVPTQRNIAEDSRGQDQANP